MKDFQKGHVPPAQPVTAKLIPPGSTHVQNGYVPPSTPVAVQRPTSPAAPPPDKK
jgi:hypothetical protein